MFQSPLPSSSHRMDYNPVLEHSLHQLLRESHHQNIHTAMPHPVTALLGMSKQRRLAGPHAHSRSELVEMARRLVCSVCDEVESETKN